MQPVDFNLISSHFASEPVKVRFTSQSHLVGMEEVVEVYAPGTLTSCALGVVFGIVRRPLDAKPGNSLHVSRIESDGTWLGVAVFPDVIRDDAFVAAMQRAGDNRFFMPVFDASDGQSVRLLRDVAALVDAPMFAVLREK